MRKPFTVLVALLVAALHFVTGPRYQGPFREFVNGHLIDILLPFSLYFLLALALPVRRRLLLFLLVFLIGFTVESLQYFGYPVFGNTFDPVDYLMYALGAGLAWLVDVFWLLKKESGQAHSSS